MKQDSAQKVAVGAYPTVVVVAVVGVASSPADVDGA